MPSWCKKPAIRAATWAVMLSFAGTGSCYLAGRYFWWSFSKETAHPLIGLFSLYVGFILILPGGLIYKFFPESYDLLGADWGVPLLSAGFYFILFYSIFRWRARRKASRESAAPQGAD
jgi:hypothetical protein